MNPLTNVKNIQKLNETELKLGVIGKKSWHDEYKDSAWVFIGGLPYDLTEGDIICVFSQYGEIVNLNLIRDHKSGKSKGFAFLCYEDQRSTVLTVDNLNGIKILGRTLRVDHVKDYKVPKDHKDDDEMILKMRSEGCAPKIQSEGEAEAEEDEKAKKKRKKEKKAKKKKKKSEKKQRAASSSSSSSSSDEAGDVKPPILKTEIKQEAHDRGYDRALAQPSSSRDFSGERRNKRGRSEERNGGRDHQAALGRVKEERTSPWGDGGHEREWSRSDGNWGRGSVREREDVNRDRRDGYQDRRDHDRDGDSGYGRDRYAVRGDRERGKDWEAGRYRGRDRDRDEGRDRDWGRDRMGDHNRDRETNRGYGNFSRDRDFSRHNDHDRYKQDRKRRDRSRER